MSVFTHLTLGTNDLSKARSFYDAVLAPLGLKRIHDMDHASIYGVDGPALFILKPRDGQPATRANGLTVGLQAPNRAAINDFHARALANGGTDEGAPGPRDFAPNAYAAYVRCPDGHKICVSCVQPE
jgi:catechol 2,3-dioxygenase-like lactoylglutathione lyase family enzyme